MAITWRNQQVNEAEHPHMVCAAKYCLVTEGYAPWTPRLVEAVKCGCVPVLMAPMYRPPFASVLDYSKFSLTFDVKDVPRLKSLLEAAPYEELHRNLLRVRPAFAYPCREARATDPEHESALTHLFAFELWRRADALDRTESAAHREGGGHGGAIDDPLVLGSSELSSLRYECDASASHCALQATRARADAAG